MNILGKRKAISKNRLTRTRSDGTKYVELKDAAALQKEQVRFEEMKNIKVKRGL